MSFYKNLQNLSWNQQDTTKSSSAADPPCSATLFTQLRIKHSSTFALMNSSDIAKKENQYITQYVLHGVMIMCLDRFRSSSGAIFLLSLVHVDQHQASEMYELRANPPSALHMLPKGQEASLVVHRDTSIWTLNCVLSLTQSRLQLIS